MKLRGIGGWVLVVALALVCPAPSRAGEVRVTDGGVYLGLDYFTGLDGLGIHDALYLTPGVMIDTGSFHLDVRSSAVLLIPDGIVGAMRFLAGVDAPPPLWDGLNSGDTNIGLLRMLESEFRYTLRKGGAMKLDLGGLFDLWWMNPEVHGKRFGNIVWNLGPSAGWGLASESVSLNVSVQVGNGFTGWGDFNPFFGAETVVRVKLVGILGAYAHAHFRRQSFDYSGFESNDINYPDSWFDIRRWEDYLSVDAGLMLGFVE